MQRARCARAGVVKSDSRRPHALPHAGKIVACWLPLVASRADQPAAAACHIDQIPPFVEAELSRLYGHLYSSLAFMQLFRPREQVSTYVDREGGRNTAVLIFQKQRRRIVVFNEYVSLDQVALGRFANHVFRLFPSIDVIVLRHLDTDLHVLPYPFQRHNCVEDYVLQLPASIERYTALLGKSTRRNIKRYSTRLMEDHPSFALQFQTGAEIDDDHVRALLRMSEEKMIGKGKRFSVDTVFAEGLVVLARKCGFVAIATIDGRLCAGLVCFRNGSHFVAKVISHDSAYDDYWLGTLCYYRTICEAIARGGTVFNLGIQRYEYKTRLLAVRRDLDHVAIYRSRWKQVWCARDVLGMTSAGIVRRAKLHLLARENSRLTRTVTAIVSRLRILRSG